MRKSLLKKIDNWVHENIITSKQKEEIINYEEKYFDSSYIFSKITYLAIFSIGLGLISIISANWKYIPDFLKLIVTFMILGTSLYYQYKSIIFNEIKKQEYLTFLTSLIIMATIGLVGQIYQLQGNLHLALTFWCSLTLPFIFFKENRSFPYMWVFFVIICILSSKMFRNLELNKANMLLLVSCAYGSIITKNITQNISKVLKYFSMILLFIQVVIIDLRIDHTLSLLMNISNSSENFMNLLLLTSIIGLFIYDYKNKNNLSTCIFLIFLFVSMFIHVPGILIFMSFIAWGMYLSYHKQNKKWTNKLTILAGIRLFIYFCSLYQNLMTSGIGLILGGSTLMLFIKGTKSVINYNNEYFQQLKEHNNDR